MTNLTGVITKWKLELGYGFIQGHVTHCNYFAHIVNWGHPDCAPEVGQQVVFDVTPDDRKPGKYKAINARLHVESAAKVGG